MNKLALGVVGASSMIAKELVEWMSKWRVNNADVHFYDTKEHVGNIQCCCDHFMPIQEVSEALLLNLDIIIFCEECLYETYANTCGTHSYCINLTQYQTGETIVIPHMNAQGLNKEDHRFYIANASLFMLATILNVAQKQTAIDAVHVTSLHAVAECGYEGCKDLQQQVEAFTKREDLESQMFPMPSSFQNLPLLFQALPQTSKFLADGITQEEAFLIKKCQSLCDTKASIYPTCVRISAMRGMAMNLSFVMSEEFKLDALIDAYASSPSCICIDDIEHDMYPICGDVIHDYRVYIGRMRQSDAHTFQAWAVCDDLSIRCAAAIQLVLYILHNFYA